MQPPAGTVLEVALLATLAWVGTTLLSVALGVGLERALAGRRVWALPLAEGQLRHERLGNALFLAVAVATTTAALCGGWVRWAAPEAATWGRAAATFLAMSVGFQAYYYAVHRLMHTRALVRFHRWHHASRVTTAWSGQSMHPVETLVWMGGYFGLAALLSLAAPLSFGGWLGYMAFNVVGNLVGHANAEPVAPHPTLWWRSTLAGAFTFHALHHARWTGHYGFASTWADRLFRTEWRDWPDLHARVSRGEALTRINQRGTER
jgi:sterol desaturase/sphingolipid hydroxylase (fatty acid hydroxylase superfamily)